MNPLNLPNSSLIVAVFTIAMGLSIALIAWLVSKALAAIPDEDRAYKDDPPLGFKLIWWPIQWINYYLAPVYRGKLHDKLIIKLRQAGLDYCLSPSQFAASRIVCAAISGLVFRWAVGSFDMPKPGSEGLSSSVYLEAVTFGVMFGWWYPGIWLKDRLGSRKRELLKTLPFFLDIITLCVEAGLNFQGAMNQAVAKGPKGVLRDELQRVLRDIRAGKARAESLRNMADRLNEPSATNFVIAVIQAESMGMNLGPILRAQADQRRTERFLRAEKLAMEAPVKMLFPLIAFIFPCTFIVLFFPIVMKFMHSGI